jgi:hypothetical protein
VISRIHQKLGTAGFIIAIIALVAALGGSALAAKGALTGKQKKEVAKIAKKEAKKFAGKDGAPGAEGKQGPAGPSGPAGAKGDIGAKGDKGDPGSPGAPGSPGSPGAAGADGASPENVEELNPEEEGCESGGVVYESEAENSRSVICNGEAGPEGSPWTDGGTLPPGATEVATWSFQDTAAQAEVPGPDGIFVPVSFPIPINHDTIVAAKTHIEYGQGETSNCPGFELLPEAPPGHVCIYENAFFSVANTSFQALERSPNGAANEVALGGAYLRFAPNTNPAELAVGAGTLAITGCSASLPAGDPNKCP